MSRGLSRINTNAYFYLSKVPHRKISSAFYDDDVDDANEREPLPKLPSQRQPAITNQFNCSQVTKYLDPFTITTNVNGKLSKRLKRSPIGKKKISIK